jgi:hypothetical protein
MVCASALAIPFIAFGEVAMAAGPEASGPPVQTPKGLAPTTDVATPPSDGTTSPPASSDALVPAPDATTPTTEAPPSEPAADAATPPASDAISPDMLDSAAPAPSTSAPAAPPATTPSAAAAPVASTDDEELTPNEAITRKYGPKFRPRNNPGRLNVAARLMFANAGGGDSAGGRLGGLSADVGQSWNHFGYAVTGTVWGGRYVAASEGTTELNALIGVGPTVGLGRMALLGRGFLDLRAGYDFYYGVVNRRGNGATVKPQDGVTLSPARNLAPHGPRVRLDLGLLALSDARRFWHGFGVSMGYQALVGSFVGKMPVAHMLTLGISYWLG